MAGERERGTRVGQKFRIVAKLGEGGMGTVYEGEHTELGHRVAIKIILASEQNDEMVKRFQREAIVLGQLESDHVVRVFDCGQLDDGAPYIVMEYLKGMDLDAYIRARGPLPVEEVAEIGIAVCDALADAHSKGIVHRDIKPSNVFLVERPGRRIVKVLDFGVSLLRRPGDESLTHQHAVLGTPLYAAPEQLTASKKADGRADLWSLGASLFELVTGEVPFPSATLSELAMNLQRPARLASTVNESVPPEFAAVLASCLQRNLADRVATAQDLRRALKSFRVLSRTSSVLGAPLSDDVREAFSGPSPSSAIRSGALPNLSEDGSANEATDVTAMPFGADQQRTPKMAQNVPRNPEIAPSPAMASMAATTMTTAPTRRGVGLLAAGLGALLALSFVAGVFVLRARQASKDAWTKVSAPPRATEVTPAPSAPSVMLLPLPTVLASAGNAGAPSASGSASALPTSPKPHLSRPSPSALPTTASSTKGLLAPAER